MLRQAWTADKGLALLNEGHHAVEFPKAPHTLMGNPELDRPKLRIVIGMG